MKVLTCWVPAYIVAMTIPAFAGVCAVHYQGCAKDSDRQEVERALGRTSVDLVAIHGGRVTSWQKAWIPGGKVAERWFDTWQPVWRSATSGAGAVDAKQFPSQTAYRVVLTSSDRGVFELYLTREIPGVDFREYLDYVVRGAFFERVTNRLALRQESTEDPDQNVSARVEYGNSNRVWHAEVQRTVSVLP